MRYFAGPLAGGGIGAVYYLDVRDPRLSARVLLVSGAGPARLRVAPTGTTGWKPGEWTGFAGHGACRRAPPLPRDAGPGKWQGPSLTPSRADRAAHPVAGGLLDGT